GRACAGLYAGARASTLAEVASPRSSSDLTEQFLNLFLERADLRVDLLERARRHVLIEVPGERNVVADLCLVVVHGGVRDVRQYLGDQILLDGAPVWLAREPRRWGGLEGHWLVRQWDVLLVAQLRVGLVERRRLRVAYGKCLEQRLL